MRIPPALWAAPRLDACVTHWAKEATDSLACVDGDQRLTYGALDKAIDNLTVAFRRVGICDGQRVAAILPPSIDFLISLLAAQRAGAVWVGINPRYTSEEAVEVIKVAKPRITLVKSDIAGTSMAPLVGKIVEQGCPCILTDDQQWFQRLEDQDLMPQKEPAPSGVGLFVFTSGTTGRPKAAMVLSNAMVIAAARRAEAWDIEEVSIPHYLPVNHIGGASDIIGPPLITGGTLYFMERFDPRAVCEAIARESLNVIAGVPASLQMCANEFDSYDLSSLRLAMFSGGRASPRLLSLLRTVAPKLITSYGMTESVASIMISDAVTDPEMLENTIGFPAPDFTIRICGNTQSGELEVKGPTLTPGYWMADEKTKAAFTEDGFYKTGDLVNRELDGSYTLIGRKSGMFKSGGYNIYPAEVEQAMERVAGVSRAVLVSVPDQMYNEVGVAFVKSEYSEMTSSALDSACREALANYKVPKQFELIDDFPLLPNGKIDRLALSKRAKAQYASATPS